MAITVQSQPGRTAVKRAAALLVIALLAACSDLPPTTDGITGVECVRWRPEAIVDRDHVYIVPGRCLEWRIGPTAGERRATEAKWR